MIELGLTRVHQLIRLLHHPLPWRAFHVAGTNGKGSICAYLSSSLRHSGLRCGRFTSPHLIDRWDCITLNDQPVSKSLFLTVEKHVHSLNLKHDIRATEFELLTATAFEIFSRERVDVAVIEVGIGGRLDATNVLPAENVVVAVVAKVGMDHEGFLGDTLGKIAREKGGIMKAGVRVVCDSTNAQEVVDALGEVAGETGAGEVRWADFERTSRVDGQVVELVTRELGVVRARLPLYGNYQNQNAQVAVEALALASTEFTGITAETVARGLEGARWPGRLDWVDLTQIAPELDGRKVLLDGAHNPQAAIELDRYVDGLRKGGNVNWVFGATKGKDVQELLRILVRPGDTLAAVGFGEVDGMPWIKATSPGEITAAVRAVHGDGVETTEAEDVADGIRAAAANGSQVVVAGSLYLIGGVMRQLRDSQ
ncbi:Mur ligase [Peziza echinospora]|nr:Mur ligase [Peziza echinospora]